MSQSEQINELVAALSAAQAQIKGAKKDAKNPFFKSDYADLTSTWEAAREPLTKNGIAVIQTMDYREDKTVLVTTLAHKSGQWIKSYLPLTVMKNDPQGIGSAITYARRYALAAIVNICPFDDDGESTVDMSDKDKGELRDALNGDPELIQYFCKRYKTNDLFSLSRADKAQIIQMINTRNSKKKGESNVA